MINKEHFTNGLIQVAIVLSLLRTDLDIYIIPPEGRLPGYPVSRLHQHETIFDSLADFSRNGNGYWSGSMNLKTVDDDHFWSLPALFSDLHSLAYYRRFDGISTNFHTWLVSEGGPARPAIGSIPAVADSSDLATGGSHDIAPPIISGVSPVEAISDANEPDPCTSYPDSGGELTKEDMELIEILYKQDIDLGIGREVFDNSYWREDGTGDEQKKVKLQENNNQHSESKQENDQSTNDGFPQLDLREHYIVDGETGEVVLMTSPTPSVTAEEYNQQQYQLNDVNLNMPDTPQIDLLRPGLVGGYSSGSAAGSGALQHTSVSYERQASLDQRWNDIFSIIEPNSETLHMSHRTLSDTESFEFQSNPAAALVQNASMNLAFEPAIDDSYTMQSDFSLASASFFPNYSSNGTDAPSLPMFVPEPVLPTGPNQTMLDVPIAVFGLDQLNLGLFSNLSLAPTVNVASNESESAGVINMNFTITPATTDSSSSYDANESHVLHDLTVDQSMSVLTAVVDGLDMNNTQALLHQMIHSDLVDDIDLSDIIDDDYVVQTDGNHPVNEEDWSSDSAVSSMASPMQQQAFRHVADVSEIPSTSEGGATGGLPKYAVYQAKNEDDSSDFFESSFPFNYEETFSGSSNFTNTQPSTTTNTKHIFHNHTYPLPHGRKSREEIEEETRREKEERATRSRDEKRAKAMKIPLTMEEIIDSSVEQFTELLTQHHLTDAQQQLVRDIRRRGKNKMAAQNCRKRKMEVIQTIEDEVLALRERRDALRRHRGDLDRSAAALKEKFRRLESELFRRLRDESGREYDPNLYALLQTEDGGVFIVPRTNTTNDRAATSDKSQDDKSGRKRKSKRKE